MAAVAKQRLESMVASAIKRQRDLQEELEANAVMVRMIAEVMEKENNTAEVEGLGEAILETARVLADWDSYCEALEAVTHKYSYKSEVVPTDFEVLIREEVKKISRKKKSSPENHPCYLAFKEAVWNVHHAGQAMPGTEDEEMVVTSATGLANVSCPLTARPVVDLEDPVRSTECQHIYDRKAVLAYLGSRQRQCPIAGCPKKITGSVVSSDAKLLMELKEMRMRAAGATQQFDDYTELD